MYLGSGILGRQLCMPCSRERAYCSENWNAQPQCIDSIKAFDISKACDICPVPRFDDENGLCKFEAVYSIHQTLLVRAIIGKCDVVQVYISCFVRKFPASCEEEELLTNLNR